MSDKCKCGSFAINLNKSGRDGKRHDLCDVCFWREELYEAKAEIERLRGPVSGTSTRAMMDDVDQRHGKESTRLRTALTNIVHASNCYDGNYARALDDVMEIVRKALVTE